MVLKEEFAFEDVVICCEIYHKLKSFGLFYALFNFAIDFSIKIQYILVVKKSSIEFLEFMNLPKTSVTRLCLIYEYLSQTPDIKRISSKELGMVLGIEAHTIRKDLNFFGEIGLSGAGYNRDQLLTILEKHLGLSNQYNACVVGLGKLGSVLLESKNIFSSTLTVVAGFDSHINRLETMSTPIELFPLWEIENVIVRKNISLALLAVENEKAQETTDLLVKSGIKGVLNFSSVHVKAQSESVLIRHVNLNHEFQLLSANIHLLNKELSSQ